MRWFRFDGWSNIDDYLHDTTYTSPFSVPVDSIAALTPIELGTKHATILRLASGATYLMAMSIDDAKSRIGMLLDQSAKR